MKKEKKRFSIWTTGWAIFLTVMVFIFCSMVAHAQAVLKVGDKVTALKTGKWLKGEPVTEFKKGRFYIVEFGTVGCSPCRASIPHFSELADKYRDKLTFISVFVMGNGGNPPKDTISESYYDKIEHFIARMGASITYSVLADGPTQATYSGWMKASGQPGVPTAFAINQNGTLAWVGHAVDLDFVIERLIAGRIGLPEFQKELENHGVDETSFKISKALRKGDFKGALAMADDQLARNPTDPLMYNQKVWVLMSFDEAEAYRVAWTALQGVCKNSEPMLYYMAREIVEPNNPKSVKTPDFDLAIALTKRALILSKDELASVAILVIQAKAFAGKKDYKSAVAADRRAIGYLDSIEEDESVTGERPVVNQLLASHEALLTK